MIPTGWRRGPDLRTPAAPSGTREPRHRYSTVRWGGGHRGRGRGSSGRHASAGTARKRVPGRRGGGVGGRSGRSRTRASAAVQAMAAPVIGRERHRAGLSGAVHGALCTRRHATPAKRRPLSRCYLRSGILGAPMRPPGKHRSVRLRLTALYGSLFLVFGAGLLALTYVLVHDATAGGYVTVVTGTAVTPTGAPGLTATSHAIELDQLVVQSGVALTIMTLASAAVGWLVAGHVLARQEAAFEAQRRFVANASHELRTPLTMMRTSLDVAVAKPEPSSTSGSRARRQAARGTQPSGPAARELPGTRPRSAGHARRPHGCVGDRDRQRRARTAQRRDRRAEHRRPHVARAGDRRRERDAARPHGRERDRERRLPQRAPRLHHGRDRTPRQRCSARRRERRPASGRCRRRAARAPVPAPRCRSHRLGRRPRTRPVDRRRRRRRPRWRTRAACSFGGRAASRDRAGRRGLASQPVGIAS